MLNLAKVFAGGIHHDERGSIIYFNDFSFDGIIRSYTIVHKEKDVVRAWQGHKIETKWFCVLKGEFKVHILKLDGWSNDSEVVTRSEYLLSADCPSLLRVPGGLLNGFISLHPDSIMTVYSDLSLEQSKEDDFRFDSSLWANW